MWMVRVGENVLEVLPRPSPLPRVVRSRDGGLEGAVTGRTWRCRLEGCRGVRVEVRWPDGTVTRPCSAGMREVEPGVWQIL
ncbi:MAG: hypothetical protein AB1816_20705 [Bacillota bacterium]